MQAVVLAVALAALGRRPRRPTHTAFTSSQPAFGGFSVRSNTRDLSRKMTTNQEGDTTATTTTDVATESPTSTTTTSESSSSSSALKAVIFDIDGTLADSWKLGFDATNQVLKAHGITTISQHVYHEHTRFTTPARLARHAGYAPGDDLYESTGEMLAKQFDDLYIGLVSTETAGFYQGIQSMLERIPPHVALGALTNAAVAYAHAVLRENSLLDGVSWSTRFVSIRGADNVPKAKPAPDGLWQVCQDLQVEPHECVYIGDSPSDGVAALAAGMEFVGVAWGSHSRESLANVGDKVVVCDCIKELEKELAGYEVIR